MQPAVSQVAQTLRRRVSGRASSGPSRARLVRRVRRLEKRVEGLERELVRRLEELEEGLLEQRALSQRIAVLGDLVAEVVSATVRGDRDDLEAALDRYGDGL